MSNEKLETNAPAPEKILSADAVKELVDELAHWKAEAERWESAYKALWKDRDEQEHIRAESQAEAYRLTAELKETNKRLALAEKLLNDWTEAELRRTGGPQK